MVCRKEKKRPREGRGKIALSTDLQQTCEILYTTYLKIESMRVPVMGDGSLSTKTSKKIVFLILYSKGTYASLTQKPTRYRWRTCIQIHDDKENIDDSTGIGGGFMILCSIHNPYLCNVNTIKSVYLKNDKRRSYN